LVHYRDGDEAVTRTRARPRPRRKVERQIADHLSVSADLLDLVWQHKLWWMVPLLIAMAALAVLVVIEATPIGPLLYPVF
jgi:heme O synthase-like polyprenyltransferase